MRRTLAGALVMVLTGGADAAAQVVQAGPLTLDFTGRVQIQLSTTSLGEDELGPGGAVPGLEFETRRVRFGTSFAYGDWMTGQMEADFAGGRATLTEAFVDVPVTDWLAVTAGQQKKPFGLFELTSNTKLLTIERTARIRGLEDYLDATAAEAHGLLDENGYVGRDIGILGHGAVGPVGYAAGVFNGSGANAREALGSKAYAARLTFAPRESLVLGAAVSRQPAGLTGADGDEVIGTAWALDGELGGFRVPGPHVMAEVMGGDDPAFAGAGEPPSMLGAHVAVGWFAPRAGRVEGVEPLVRVSWGDPDTDAPADAGTLVTPGVNLYFTGRNRLMLNGDVFLPAGEGLDAQYALAARLQVYF